MGQREFVFVWRKVYMGQREFVLLSGKVYMGQRELMLVFGNVYETGFYWLKLGSKVCISQKEIYIYVVNTICVFHHKCIAVSVL